MTKINFKQKKPVKAVIFGLLFLLISILGSTGIVQFVVLLIVGLILLGYRITYRINKDFRNYKIISIFGISLLKLNLILAFPDYISIFGANFSRSNDFGPVAALGTQHKSDEIVIRFFNGSENNTIFMSDNYNLVKEKANALHEMLGVELVDNVNS